MLRLLHRSWEALAAIWFMFLSPAPILGIEVCDTFLQLAREQGHLDTFISFRPFDFGSRNMRRMQQALLVRERRNKKKYSAPYGGIQEFSSPLSGRPLKRTMVARILKEHARISQQALTTRLRRLGYQYRSFWINNSLMVRNAPLHFILSLSSPTADSDEGIVGISGNRVVAYVPLPEKFNPRGLHSHNVLLSLAEDGGILWNLKMIGADKVWPHSKGENVIVASIDTGVDFTHPLIKDKYRGLNADLQSYSHSYNWFDPEGRTPSPRDVHGHGTHTIGTIVGDMVGVAPKAKWIAAQGCGAEQCTQEHLLASAQWVMCPSDTSGQNERCDMGADIINNSWGGEATTEESLTWFNPIVQAWLEAGIIPIFAQGNAGPDCATAGTPGDLANVIGVGAVDKFGSLSFFSSRGPGNVGEGHANLKPDLVAPGQEIISSRLGGTIVAMSGTSMAAPHVTGVAALLLSIDPTLEFDRFRDLLLTSACTAALREPQIGQSKCSNKPWSEFPNYHYGHGLIDAASAARKLINSNE